ncbi:LacI family DNA-binding transcriptional regulator [Saccharibacillus sp. CPCC 101409]|uniref:LacI family DNA-binding transcriptional regulator n=1 Tax=Saccharibacillus sp. CPCC 101409 TaxID=3058041 RepID=UPI002670DC8A|nr:LacI family DNA-binding transcriptional regulator [Saccharibacillus sp. CPCC 101409]MDO3409250.1 LacI family DNA-binding transcriptional regulator [Saccharibacillus sp. CPCC 101409]
MSKPTIYDVAREAGVSIATVSKVLNNNGRISDKTRQRIEGIMRELNYEPSRVASALTRSRTGTIGLMIPDIANPFFAEAARCFEDGAQRSGSDLIICSTDRDDEKAARYLSMLLRRRVDGLIIASHTGDESGIARLLEGGMPTLLFSAELPSLNCGSIGVDDYAGGRRATEYLLSLGHRRIGIISDNLPGSRLREQGYLDALREAGLPPVPPEHSVRTSATLENGRTAAREMLGAEPGIRPTAVFACNDLLAIGVLKQARAAGLSVPRDLSVIGFDNTMLADICQPALSTISQPLREMTRRAMDMLNAAIDDPAAPVSHIRVEPELVVRDSAGPAPESERSEQ